MRAAHRRGGGAHYDRTRQVTGEGDIRFALLLASSLLTCSAFAQGTDIPPGSALSAIVEARLAEAETPACIAAGRVTDGRVEMHFGCAAGAGPAAFDEHSLFEIGSISKGLTGLLLADMIGKGEMRLDDMAKKHSRQGALMPQHGEDITIRELVTHSSGLPRLPPGFKTDDLRDPYADYTVDALYRAIAETKVDGRRGNVAYSNFGFMWLSEILARRAGQPYEIALKSRILEPLGMNETTVVVDEVQQRRFVTGHRVGYEAVPHWNFPPEMAGFGGVRSSLHDMLRLGAAMADPPSSALATTISMALQPTRPSIGFAWEIRNRGNGRTYEHGGSTGGFTSYIAVNQETKTAGVVLVDAAVGFVDLAIHLVDPNFPLRKKRIGMQTPPETFPQYVGHYEFPDSFAVDVVIDGPRLMARGTRMPALELLREGPDTFFHAGRPTRLRFNRDREGRVESLLLVHLGKEYLGKRRPGAEH